MEPVLPTEALGRQMDLLCTDIGRKENFSSRNWGKPSCSLVGFTPERGFGLEGAAFLQELLSSCRKGLKRGVVPAAKGSWMARGAAIEEPGAEHHPSSVHLG